MCAAADLSVSTVTLRVTTETLWVRLLPGQEAVLAAAHLGQLGSQQQEVALAGAGRDFAGALVSGEHQQLRLALALASVRPGLSSDVMALLSFPEQK